MTGTAQIAPYPQVVALLQPLKISKNVFADNIALLAATDAHGKEP
jgi:hypothetical protein